MTGLIVPVVTDKFKPGPITNRWSLPQQKIS